MCQPCEAGVHLNADEHFDEIGKHFVRSGVAKERGLRNLCRMKLYLFSSNQELLTKIIFEASGASDCYEVRLLKEGRSGVFAATCDFTNESSLGDIWARYTQHPEVWATIQNEEFSSAYTSRIRTY